MEIGAGDDLLHRGQRAEARDRRAAVLERRRTPHDDTLKVPILAGGATHRCMRLIRRSEFVIVPSISTFMAAGRRTCASCEVSVG